ncbi:MAG: dethiobiotin synthase [Nitrospirae bacterium]|nr:dethiobiotin synthase [Nitrospirota bacterium]MCL5286186.1 dethiobiotin synthase [Nitrospirota bacterium]
MRRGVFITGTDTGVGKTWIGTALVRLLSRSGVAVRPRKPVESGCPDGNDGLIPQDGADYHAATGGGEPLGQISRFLLRAALSPERAAALQDVEIRMEDVVAACLDGVQENDFLLVEGAGGFCSPLTADGLNADLGMVLGLPVLLVTADRLGAIHQTLATAEAITRRGLTLAGVVLNEVTPVQDSRMDNAADLSRWLGQEIISIRHCPGRGISTLNRLSTGLSGLAGRLVEGSNMKDV